MRQDDAEGVGGWWAEALRDAPEVRSASSGPLVTKDLIAQWRAERKPLPKPSGRAWKAVGRTLHEHDSDLCGICFTPIDIALASPHPGSLQVDHIYPLAGYGSNSWDNIQIAHRHCNVMKSSFIEGYPTADLAAETLRVAVAHWEDKSQLEADLRTLGEEWTAVHSKQEALFEELRHLSEDDPQLEARRAAEQYPLYVEREAILKTYVLYSTRLFAHQRRAQKAAPANDQSDR
jgi:5-methylcytosine-specific restriction endonuclease McrA